MESEHHRFFYNTVFSQTISTSGKYLFAGNRFGDIFIQSLDILNADPATECRPRIVPQGERTPILSLAFHRDFLIVGTTGIIYGIKWDEELGDLLSERQWKIKIPITDEAYEATDVNHMWLSKERDMLYAGCSDNVIYQISLEDGTIRRDYQGHTNFIHSLTGTPDGSLYTASEDGTVQFWKENVKESVNQIEPSCKESLARPNLGKWIGDVNVSNDWLLCGGGPELSLWHLKSLDCMQVFSYPGPIHVCEFVEDNVLVAGEHKSAKLYEMSSKLLADIVVENSASYSIVWQIEPIKFMSIAGYSNKLHIMKDFRYIDSKIDLYQNPFSDDDDDELSSDESKGSDDDNDQNKIIEL